MASFGCTQNLTTLHLGLQLIKTPLVCPVQHRFGRHQLRVLLGHTGNRSSRSLLATERNRQCPPEPSQISRLVIRPSSPRIDDVVDESTFIIINLLVSNHTSVGSEDGLCLLLDRQSLVITERVAKLLVRGDDLTGVVGHNGTRGLREIILRVKTAKSWSGRYSLIRSLAIGLKLEFVRVPGT